MVSLLFDELFSTSHSIRDINGFSIAIFNFANFSLHYLSYRYEKAFKEEAVKLSDEIGVKKASDQLGVAYSTLCSWRGKRKKHGDLAYVGSGYKYSPKGVLPKELALERENEELRRSNAILKEALVFFVKDQKK